MKEKVILAYSGGLDTTAIIPWLKENFDYEVICVCADCGQGEELDGLQERALSCGASKLYIENIKELEKEKELNWYFERIDLLYKFLEKLLPTALKNYQYLSKVYAATEWNYCIPNEINGVKKMYKKLFNEELLYEGE